MPKNQSKTDEDERPAAVIVVTVIKPGEASLSASPSAIVKVSQDIVDQMHLAHPNFALLDYVKSMIVIELDSYNPKSGSFDPPSKGRTVYPHSVLPPSNEHDPVARELLGLDTGAELVEQAERDDPRHWADEHTPADHFFNS